jgi:hypothetical protein
VITRNRHIEEHEPPASISLAQPIALAGRDLPAREDVLGQSGGKAGYAVLPDCTDFLSHMGQKIHWEGVVGPQQTSEQVRLTAKYLV